MGGAAHRRRRRGPSATGESAGDWWSGSRPKARRLGVEGIALGTDEAVGLWYHLGYTLNLLFQWVYDAERWEAESRALLEGPLAGLRHWRSSFNGVPQLFVELDEPRLDLRQALSGSVSGYHVGFMIAKPLAA